MKIPLSWFRHHSAARVRRTLPAGLILLSSLVPLWGLVCMATSAARADEGMNFRQSARQATPALRVHAHAGMAGPRSFVERALQRRRFRFLCKLPRAGTDQSPRGFRPVAEGLNPSERLCERRILRPDPGAGIEVPGPRIERPDLDRERHGARRKRLKTGYERQGRPRSA